MLLKLASLNPMQDAVVTTWKVDRSYLFVRVCVCVCVCSLAHWTLLLFYEQLCACVCGACVCVHLPINCICICVYVCVCGYMHAIPVRGSTTSKDEAVPIIVYACTWPHAFHSGFVSHCTYNSGIKETFLHPRIHRRVKTYAAYTHPPMRA
jgi:hypothetical protein